MIIAIQNIIAENEEMNKKNFFAFFLFAKFQHLLEMV